MAIEEIDDYPEKMAEFELHWQSVNAALGGTPETEFKLLGGYALADFSADKAAVVAALTAQEGLDNQLDFARSDRDTLRADLRQRLILFRDTVKNLLPGSRYLRALPATPDQRAEAQKMLDAWDDMAHVWTQINADAPAEVAPEMSLRGGYTLAAFQAEVVTMRTRYDTVKGAERAAADGRGDRDELLDAAYARMRQYRDRLPITLEPDDPLVASLPILNRSNSSSTPDTLTLSGEWQDPPGEAVLTWTASTDPNLDHYEVRVSSGSTFDPTTATSAGQTQPGTDELRTTENLNDPEPPPHSRCRRSQPAERKRRVTPLRSPGRKRFLECACRCLLVCDESVSGPFPESSQDTYPLEALLRVRTGRRSRASGECVPNWSLGARPKNRNFERTQQDSFLHRTCS